MLDLQEEIQIKMKYVEDLLSRLENRENVSVLSILKEEIKNLGTLCKDYNKTRDDKLVIKKEENMGKIRYYLKDGSVYVVKGKEYRYLYDSKTKVVTYEFENGQIERTFFNGIKEIRKNDGTIIIKNGSKDYDYL